MSYYEGDVFSLYRSMLAKMTLQQHEALFKQMKRMRRKALVIYTLNGRSAYALRKDALIVVGDALRGRL